MCVWICACVCVCVRACTPILTMAGCIQYVYVRVQVCVVSWHVHFWEAGKIFMSVRLYVCLYVCMCACYAYMQIQMCVYCVTVGCACAFTFFSDSGAHMIARLLFWHTQQRSDIGFMTVVCGLSYLHSEQVVYAATLSPGKLVVDPDHL